MPLLRFVILKQVADERVGISFVAEDEDELSYGALVSRCQCEGIAEAAGLLKGDRVLSINGQSVSSAASAAATIRNSLGDVEVVVERPEREEEQRRLETESSGDAMRDHSTVCCAVLSQTPTEQTRNGFTVLHAAQICCA